jgi:hypothetical protein
VADPRHQLTARLLGRPLTFETCRCHTLCLARERPSTNAAGMETASTTTHTTAVVRSSLLYMNPLVATTPISRLSRGTRVSTMSDTDSERCRRSRGSTHRRSPPAASTQAATTAACQVGVIPTRRDTVVAVAQAVDR